MPRAMRISGLVVSVDYAPQLSRTLAAWRDGLDNILVLTAARDLETIAVCEKLRVPYHLTDEWWRGGAYFNKALGMMEGIPRMAWDDWILLFDADLIPPMDWRNHVEWYGPRPGTLYGAYRNGEDGRPARYRNAPRNDTPHGRYRLDMMCGHFHLFHVTDPNAPRAHLLDTRWQTAAWYDTEFEVRWDQRKARIPMFVCTHIGQVGVNWCGVGNERTLRKVMRQPMPLHKSPALQPVKEGSGGG